MKLTVIKKDEEKGLETWSTCETDAFFEKIKTETKTGYVSGLRAALPGLEGSSARYIHINKLPRVHPAVEYARVRNGEKRMKCYNGLVQLEVNHLADTYEVEHVKQQAAQLPQTFAAFCGSSGRSVKIWVRFARPDGTMPSTPQEATLFHAHAYRLAVTCYQPLLSFGITLKEADLTQSCRMTLDEEPYYNPSAVPFYLEQPLALPDEETFRQRKQSEETSLERMVPGEKALQTFALMYEAARRRALDEMENWKRSDGLEPLLPHLMEQCFRAGIPEEEAVRRTLTSYFHEKDTDAIRLAFNNVYKEMRGFGTKSCLSKEQEATFRLEEFLKRRYEFRFNTVLGEVEYRQRDSIHFYFHPLEKRVRNSIALCALKEGLQVWDRDVDRFLASDFVPVYNPVEEYLCDVGRWDGVDRIRALARLVPCRNPHWEELFYRWFLSMVAHWRGMDRQHGNSTSPLLVGSQGFRKSTFCRILLPPELRFGYTDSLDFSSKQEAERALGRFFLINLDEFDQITVNQQGFLKHLLQKPSANLRKPYDTSIREMRRYASFIGTSNQKDLLTDPSGSRRFICIEVEAPIDTNVSINYRQLYAQAMHLIYKGERYWLDDKDEAVLRQTNSEFEQISPLEQLYLCCFSSSEPEEEGEWMTAMEIFNYLQSQTRDKMSLSKIGRFGRILRKLNVPWKSSKRETLYHVVKLK